MCCNLELKTLNRKTTASFRNHRKRRVCSDPCFCTTHQDSFFSSKILHEVWRIFPRSFDIVVTSYVPIRYLTFCTKQTRKQSLFLSTTSGTSRDLSWMTSFSWPHGVSLFGNIKRCVVSSAIWCRTWTVCFFRSLLRIFSSFPPISVCEMKVLWKVAHSCAKRFETHFFLYT